MTLREHYGRILRRLLWLRKRYADEVNEIGADLLDRAIYACELELEYPKPEAAP